MKKFLLLLPLFLVVTSVTMFARSADKVDPRAEQEFKKYFADAQNVKWSKEEGGYLRASFTWGNHMTLAYFNSNAELVGSIRGLSFSQLPLVVMRSVESNYKDAIILEINEITNSEGTQYRMIIEEKNKKYTVRLNSFGDILQKEKLNK